MLTVLCIAVVWVGLFAAGLPLALLLRRAGPGDEASILLAPLLGLAGLTLVLQNLVHLNIPVRAATPFVWALMALACAAAWWCRRRTTLSRWPLAVFAAGGGAYLLHAGGLFIVGAGLYVGWGWPECCSCDELAQFLRDWPLRTPLSAVGVHNLFLAGPMAIKHDSIGQAVLQAFFASSCGLDAKPLLGPMLLLLPGLTVPAVYLVGQRQGLARPVALLSGLAAGCLPALAMIHLAGYLSQALAIPLLLIFPIVLEDLLALPSGRSLLGAVVILAGGAAVCPELLILFLAVFVLMALLTLIRRRVPWQRILWMAAVPIGAIIVHPSFRPRLMDPVLHGRAVWATLEAFPWAFSVEGWSRLWSGELADANVGGAAALVRILGLGLAGMGYVGLAGTLHAAFQEVWANPQIPAGRLALARAAAVMALAVLPLLILVKGDLHHFAFYKLLLSISPLLVLGQARLAGQLADYLRWRARCWASVRYAVPISVLVLGGAGSLQLALATAHPKAQSGYFASLMHSPDMAHLQERLSGTHGEELVLAGHDPYLNRWLTYLGRQQRVHRMEPDFLTPALRHALEPRSLWGSASIPQRATVVAHLQGMRADIQPGDMSLEWRGEQFQLWHARSPRWAVPVCLESPQQLLTRDGQPFFVLEHRPTHLVVLAGAAGDVTLTARLVSWNRRRRPAVRLLRIESDHGQYCDIRTRGDFTATLNVRAGINDVWLWALDEPFEEPTPKEDRQSDLVGIQGMGSSYRDAEAGPCP